MKREPQNNYPNHNLNLKSKHQKTTIMEHRLELTQTETKSLLSRLPIFELSYEIFKHNTTTPCRTTEEWSFHIPVGPKWFLWFSFRGKKHGLYWMELNRNHLIQRVFFEEATPPSSLDISAFYGSIFYGTQTPVSFVLEDVFYFKGNFVHCLPEISKWELFPPFLQQHRQYSLSLPVINGDLEKPVPYPTHHIQIRHLTKTCPFTNYPVSKSPIQPQKSQPNPNQQHQFKEAEIDEMDEKRWKPVYKNWRKEQYQKDTVFSVQADPADDIYRLYTFGPNRTLLFYDFCMVPDYETSKKMNSLFRRLRENQNLDWIEESDDEDETNNSTLLEQQHRLITCRFHTKFRKWVPIDLAPPKSRVVHICQL